MKSIKDNEEMCSVCEAEPQDMLILSCRHNLCLDCATEIYNLNSKGDKIACEICLSNTQLDEDTVVCLRSLSAKQIKQSQKEPLQYIGLNQSQNRQLFPPKNIKTGVNFHPTQVPLIVDVQIPEMKCEKHQQALTYFCMDCNNFRICSQCMLLDNHRFHKVITLKKATIQVKETIQKVIREKQRLKTMLQKDKQSLIIRKQQSQKQMEVNIAELKSTFEQINKKIFEKYNQLAKIMEQEGNRKLEIMEGAINEIQQKINLIQETIQFQEELIRSSLACKKTVHSGIQMFEYYEKEIAENKVNFEPSLPNFIMEITSTQLYQKDYVFSQLQSILEQFKIISPQQTTQDHDVSQQEINYISQIDPREINLRQREVKVREIQKHKSTKNNYQQKYSQNANLYQQLYPKTISENINIIQLTSTKQQQHNKPSNFTHSKLSKEGVEAIKRKARQNLKDRQLSQSRKMQLSRSIENANDILNKIQQRSIKI